MVVLPCLCLHFVVKKRQPVLKIVPFVHKAKVISHIHNICILRGASSFDVLLGFSAVIL